MLLFPPRQDAEASLKAYIEETSDIPLPWLLEGVRGFKDEGQRVFLPAISEVRTACAKCIRSERRKASGESEHSVTGQSALDVAGLLEWARTFVPNGLAQMEHACGTRGRLRYLEAQNAKAVSEEDTSTIRRAIGDLTRVTLELLETSIEAEGLTPQLKQRQRERARKELRGVR